MRVRWKLDYDVVNALGDYINYSSITPLKWRKGSLGKLL